MSTSLIQGILIHGPWAAFALVMFFAYSKLVYNVILATQKNAEAFTQNSEAIRQITQVMVEVKDAMLKCRKVDR